MADTGRPKLTVRMDPDEQERFIFAAENYGMNGAALVRQFIGWFLGDHDNLPERPGPESGVLLPWQSGQQEEGSGE